MTDAFPADRNGTGPPPDPAGPVLDALGDPTRRRLLGLLRDGERTVADLTAALPVTQSAVSQHLRVLRDAGLVSDRPDGRRRYYRVDRDGLSAVRAYVDAFWDDVLEAFAAYAESPASHDPEDPR
ncbi:metalloregulator ArsR/SmtB family transcription factor [Kineosporia sp. A_224]|uniref:ArsR/SmtB family transcription factor n=1 Tax=Kineosporia sp. A_224 TaxID=1962180 RepID=UPI000B4AD797|nr:metalloregulator ArsR/SmtB family transcription factor [Kineosporia sp. A_224]